MNLNELWSGNDYAYYPNKGRGEVYRRGYQVYRVKIIRTFQEKLTGNERMSGFAEVLYCDKDTGEPEERSDGSHKTGKVRARDIAIRWDEYADLHEQKEAEREEEEREYEKRRLEREARYREEARIREERRIAEQKERERLAEEERLRKEREHAAITDYLTSRGIPSEAIASIGADYVYLNRKVIETICLVES